MPRRRGTIPKYCLHKSSGQACVYEPGTGAIRYLGPHGSAESHRRYAEFLDELQHPRSAAADSVGTPPGVPLSLSETIARYRTYAKSYYVGPDGKTTKEFVEVRYALRPLRLLYGDLLARDFGPKKLKLLRQHLVDVQKLSRGVVNNRINRVKRFFKWAVAEELVPPSVYEGLRAVGGLRYGRTNAHEAAGVSPVPIEHVQATLPYLSPQVRAMVELQLLGGMRPNEVVKMRADELDMSSDVWVYAPRDHKNRWRGKRRAVPLGPQAQAILAGFLPRGDNPYLFSPAEAEAWRHEERAVHRDPNRKTKVYPCELRARERRKAASQRRKVRRPKRARYDVDSYRRAIEYALKRLNADRADPRRTGGGVRLRHTPIRR